MNTNRKILLIVTLMLLGLTAATIINVALHFRDYAYSNAVDKSKMTAEIVRDGLTAHMVNGIMDKRQFFLSNIANVKDVEKLWIVRSPNVIKQYGEGALNEGTRDAIDKQVLETGVEVRKIIETAESAIMRVTIPYTASAYSEPKCLDCHDVKEGDVLGAISMEFAIDEIRYDGALTIAKILGINLLFIIIALFIINHYIKPYLSLFQNLQAGIQKAHHGDFSHRMTSSIRGQGGEVAQQMNSLFERMQGTFSEIKDNLTTFVARTNIASSNPLNDAKEIIRELADVYKFKKTIELDADKDAIYERIILIMREKFHIGEFILYEVDKNDKQMNIVYSTDEEKTFCKAHAMEDAEKCRAYRTNSDVISTDFPKLCDQCARPDMEHLCIPFTINSEFELLFSISSETAEGIEKIMTQENSIRSYLEAAKPVIESKMLMSKLRDSSLRDGLTGLYNRRFLEEFIDKMMGQAKRTNTTYAVLMLDVDYFKMVNDTYGHDVGDIVIRGLSDVITTHIREADLAIRFGGEEFTILLHNATDEGALLVAEKIHQGFNEKIFNAAGTNFQKTLSIGIAYYPDHGDTMWKAIKFADTALYEAKHSGRNKVVVFESTMSNYEEESRLA